MHLLKDEHELGTTYAQDIPEKALGEKDHALETPLQWKRLKEGLP
jgi:hypothetical protein